MQKFQNFRLNMPSGEIFDCAEYKGDAKLLLVFYKGAWCNFCKRQLTDMARNYRKLEKAGLKIVAISNDSQLNSSLLSALTMHRFPILSDTDGAVAKSLGAGGGKNALPSIFIVDEKNQISLFWRAIMDEERISFKEIMKRIGAIEKS